MRTRPCNDTIRTATLLSLALSKFALSTWVTAATTSSIPSVASPSTCPSRSINYITQTLPQQCLTSSWASKPVAQNSTILEAAPSVDALAALLTANVSILNIINASQAETALAGSSSSRAISESQISESQTSQPNANAEPSKRAKPTEELDQETDPDSPLDNANFLSFEEWKHQNLAKAGQSAENLGSREAAGGIEHRRRPGGISNALESLGEDSEIDIDFSGFGNAGGMNDALPVQSALPRSSSTKEEVAQEKTEDLSSPRRRSKDAGKTCKERSNYASFDCAATALKANPECKGATSVLVESKDSYMLNVCSANNKFFIVELCDDILIDTVVLANFEYFSSMFRTFRVSVSDRYPVKIDKWKELGTFEARNSREIQAFLIENPLIWARYLRIEFMTHYGAEYYCPVSLLRVHGTTMMEEFNHEVKGSRGEDEIEPEAGEGDDEATVQTPDVVSADVLKIAAQAVSERSEESVPFTLTSTATLTGNVPFVPLETASTQGGSSAEGFTPYNSLIGKGLEDMLSCKNDPEGLYSYVHQSKEANPVSTSFLSAAHEPETSAKASKGSSVKTDDNTASQETKLSLEETTIVTSTSQRSPSTLNTPQVSNDDTTLSTHITSDTSGTSVTSSAGDNSASSNTSSVTSSVRANSTSLATSSSKVSSPYVTSSLKVSSSSTQPYVANPSTQESFFKSVHKRLQQLEANSSLSLQYIEEQSRILRDAFSKVEKRQLSKTSNFLETLNTTVLTELRDFRMQYDQIWQSTVLELSSQREQSAQEVAALSARMTFLADEVVFQKRMAMIQFMLILLCLGLVMFSCYGGPSAYLELPPLVQNAINKSSANLARYTHFETPPASPPTTRPPSTGASSKYGLFRRKKHHRSPSDESDVNGRAKSPTIEYSPPTPESQYSHGDRNASPSGPSGDESETLSFGDLMPGDGTSRETKSSPNNPSDMREEHREVSRRGLC